MLTKMPKVGDVLIANEQADYHYNGMTDGKGYVVYEVGSDGDAWFLDDDGDKRFIDSMRFYCFMLKSESNIAEPVGFISMEPEIAKDTYVIEVFVDDDGYKAIEALAKQSHKQRNRTEIQAKIDALQAGIAELREELKD